MERAPLQKFNDALEGSDFPGFMKDETPSSLKRRIREFRACPENRGSRRVKREPMRRVRKTLRHLAHAVRHAHEHVDSNVCTKARELVRSIRCESFEAIERRASKFNGLLRRVGHRLKEQQFKDARSRINAGDHEIVELNSVEQLVSEGRKLGLCVGHKDELGREYHRRLRREENAANRFFTRAEDEAGAT